MASARPPKKASEHQIIVYASPRSPGAYFAAKVLVALDSRSITHYCNFVSIDASKRKLPSGGRMVPEMTVQPGLEKNNMGGTNDLCDIVPDSEDILQYLDRHFGTEFYPNDLARSLARRANEGALLGAGQYYGLLWPKAYKRATQADLVALMPVFPYCCVRRIMVDRATSVYRVSRKLEIAKQLDIPESELESHSKTEPLVRAKLLAELEFFQAQLIANGVRAGGGVTAPRDHVSKGTPFLGLVPHVSQPTGADIAVYCQLERLVDRNGDSDFTPILPEIMDVPGLDVLWAWQAGMRRAYPIKCRGWTDSSSSSQ